MCILCAGAKLSRRIVAMLPWLIIPFLIVWAFSQFLPPGYRFEITSTRLACVGVLLGSLFWYEFVVPNLSQWRERRAVLLRERQRIEAQKAARWRKEATKHCRNCHAAYRDQNPQASGKYMCTSCGHTSKKPELHVPGTPRPREPKSDHSTCWDSLWEELDKQRVFHVLHGWVVLGAGFSAWLWGCFCRQEGSSRDGVADRLESGSEIDEVMERREKARRKAEEKRLARLEREKKEEEEQREREEIRRLVDERSRLRAEMIEAENASKREAAAAERERERKDREAEKKKQEQEKARAAVLKEKEMASSEKSVGSGGNVEESRSRSGYFGRRRGYNHFGEYRNSRSSYGSSSFSAKGKSSANSGTPVKSSTTPDGWKFSGTKVSTPPGTSMSWSKALCGTAANTKAETCRVSREVSPKPQANGCSLFSENVSDTARSLKWQHVSPESPPPCSETSTSSPVSSDPIYFPITAPALPPISAPQTNSLSTETAASFTSLFSSLFPSTTVLPPPTSVDATYSVMSPTLPSPLSQSASSGAAWPEQFSRKPSPDPRAQLPEEICLSPSFENSRCWPPQYDYEENVPPEFLDCITRDIMVDPVTTADGHSYDRSTIKAWLEEHKTSPITGIELPAAPPPDSVDRTLRPNHVLRSQILDYNERKARERACRDGSAAVSPWPVPVAAAQKQHNPPQFSSCGLFISPGLQSMW